MVVKYPAVALPCRTGYASVLRSNRTGQPLILEYQKSGPPCPAAAPMPLRCAETVWIPQAIRRWAFTGLGW